jgi:hypothetical protein
MDAYTQSSHFKQFSLSGIIKLVYNCIQRELNVCEYVAMPRTIVFRVTLWHVNMSLRLYVKTLKDLLAVSVDGGIVK